MGGVRERAAAARHDVLQGAAVVQAHGIALVVVDVAAYGGHVVVSGVADDVVDGAAALDGARVVLAVHVQGRPRDEYLRARVQRDLPQPRALRGVDPAQQPGVDADDPYRTGVDRPVRSGLHGPLLRPGPQCARLVEPGAVPGTRTVPQQGAQPGPGEGTRRGGGRRRWDGVAEDAHESGQVLVPVVVPRYRVDRGPVVPVGAEELGAVVVGAAHRVDHIAGEHGERGAVTLLQQARHHRVLGLSALAGVAEDQEREPVRIVAPDHLVGGRPGRLPAGDPAGPDLRRGVTQPRGQDAVAGRPQRSRVEPGDLLDLVRHQPPVRTALRGAPAGTLGGIT